MARKKASPTEMLTSPTFRVAVMLHGAAATVGEFTALAERAAACLLGSVRFPHRKAAVKLLIYAPGKTVDPGAAMAGMKIAVPSAWLIAWRGVGNCPDLDLSSPTACLDDALRHCVERMDEALVVVREGGDIAGTVDRLERGEAAVRGVGHLGVLVAPFVREVERRVKDGGEEKAVRVREADPAKLRELAGGLWR